MNKEEGEPQVAINGRNDGDATRNEVAAGYGVGYVASDFVCHLRCSFLFKLGQNGLVARGKLTHLYAYFGT